MFDRCATPSEALREQARNIGMDRPEQPWILTDWDVWQANPFYQGPPVPHPEDAFDGYMPPQEPLPVSQPTPDDYEIPF